MWGRGIKQFWWIERKEIIVRLLQIDDGRLKEWAKYGEFDENGEWRQNCWIRE